MNMRPKPSTTVLNGVVVGVNDVGDVVMLTQSVQLVVSAQCGVVDNAECICV